MLSGVHRSCGARNCIVHKTEHNNEDNKVDTHDSRRVRHAADNVFALDQAQK